MSKFKLRNLMNEKRRLEKEIEKLERKIEMVKAVPIEIGTIEETFYSECNTTHRGGKRLISGRDYRFRYTFTKIDREVICDLYCPNTHIGVRGKAKCSDEDVFVLEKGMKLAEKRALAEYYKSMAQKTMMDL